MKVKMRILFLKTLLTMLLYASGQIITCKRNIYCVNDRTFKLCANFDNFVMVVSKFQFSCLNGFTCNSDSYPPCVAHQYRHPFTFPTTTSSTTSITCPTYPSTPIAHPSTIHSTTPATISTSTPPTSTTVSTSSTHTHSPTTTETTTSTGTTLHNCIKSNRKPTAPTCPNAEINYPGLTCDTYWQCTQVVWWWYEAEPANCPSGQYYNEIHQHCVPDTLCICN